MARGLPGARLRGLRPRPGGARQPSSALSFLSRQADIRPKAARGSTVVNMDISSFDFELDEIVALIPKLTGLAQIIELEPRLHNADEEGQTHQLRGEPTFRISCYLSGNDQAVSRLAVLAADLGAEAVVDLGRSVRFRHLRPEEATSPMGANGGGQPTSRSEPELAPEGAGQTQRPQYEEQGAPQGREQ